MKRGILVIVFVMLVIMDVPMNASTDTSATAEEEVRLQPRFTNISVFYNDFYITDQGKAVLTLYIDARNVYECKINMYLQKYQNESWVTVKHWSASESGTFCGIGETWYFMSGYQYRMKSYAYVYSDKTLLESTVHTSKTEIY